MLKSGSLNSSHANQFVLIAGAATCTGRTQDLPLGILDKNGARLWQKLAPCGGSQRTVKVRIVLGTLAQCPAGSAHSDGSPSLAGRNVDAKHAGAILALQRPNVPGFVENDDRHWAILSRTCRRECCFDDRIRLRQCNSAHDIPPN